MSITTTSTFIHPSEKKSQKTTKPFTESNVFKIATAATLLSSVQRKTILKNIQETAAAPEEYFEIFYRQLIHNCTEFVQILPVNNEARLASLMDEGIFRGLFSLQKYKQDVSENFDPLMAYILFSTALLFDVGSVIENRTVLICTKTGEVLRKWNPHDGAMNPEEGYYRIRRGGGTSAWSSRRLNVAFAAALTPKEALTWIYSNPHAYNTWIALLHYDREGAGRFSIYLDHSLEMLERFKLNPDFLISIDAQLINNSEGMSDAENFIDWLKNSIKSGNLTLNNNLFLLQDGLFLPLELLRDYNNSIHRDIRAEALLQQLQKLGLTNATKIEHVTASEKTAGTKRALSMFRGDRSGTIEHTKSALDIPHDRDAVASALKGLSSGAPLQGMLITKMEEFASFFPITTPYSSIVKKIAATTTLSSKYPELESIQPQETYQTKT